MALPVDGAPTHFGSSPIPGDSDSCRQGGGAGGCRLNLLLSYAGWYPHSWADRLPVLLEPMGIRALRAASGRQASELIHVFPVHIAVVDLALPLEIPPGGPALRADPVRAPAVPAVPATPVAAVPAAPAGAIPHPTSDIPHPTSSHDAGPVQAARSTEEAGIRILDLLSRLRCPPPILVIKRSRTHRDDSREIAAALRANAFAVLDRPRDTRDLERLLDTLRRCLDRHYRGRWPLS